MISCRSSKHNQFLLNSILDSLRDRVKGSFQKWFAKNIWNFPYVCILISQIYLFHSILDSYINYDQLMIDDVWWPSDRFYIFWRNFQLFWYNLIRKLHRSVFRLVVVKAVVSMLYVTWLWRWRTLTLTLSHTFQWQCNGHNLFTLSVWHSFERKLNFSILPSFLNIITCFLICLMKISMLKW